MTLEELKKQRAKLDNQIYKIENEEEVESRKKIKSIPKQFIQKLSKKVNKLYDYRQIVLFTKVRYSLVPYIENGNVEIDDIYIDDDFQQDSRKNPEVRAHLSKIQDELVDIQKESRTLAKKYGLSIDTIEDLIGLS